MIKDLNTDNNSVRMDCQIFNDRKVEFVFGLQGGHIQPYGITVIN